MYLARGPDPLSNSVLRLSLIDQLLWKLLHDTRFHSSTPTTKDRIRPGRTAESDSWSRPVSKATMQTRSFNGFVCVRSLYNSCTLFVVFNGFVCVRSLCNSCKLFAVFDGFVCVRPLYNSCKLFVVFGGFVCARPFVQFLWTLCCFQWFCLC